MSMTNKDYILMKHIDDIINALSDLGSCDFCHKVGCVEYCNSHESPMTCEETFKEWLDKEYNPKTMKLEFGKIVEVKLPTDTQLCYYVGHELGVYYITNSKKTCEQIKELGLKQISKADLIVLLGCDLPLCISKVGD